MNLGVKAFQTASLGITVCILLTTVSADTLIFRGMQYPRIKAVGVSGDKLVFETSGGSTLSKPLADVDYLKLDDYNDFTKAEDLLAKKDFKQAIAQYKIVKETRVRPVWMKDLVAARLKRIEALTKKPDPKSEPKPKPKEKAPEEVLPLATEIPQLTKPDPLMTLDTLVRHIAANKKEIKDPRKDPSWRKKTSLRQEAEVAKYEADLKAMGASNAKFFGKTVVWMLRISDVQASTEAKGSYVLTGRSAGGTLVQAVFGPDQRDSILDLEKEQVVAISGTLRAKPVVIPVDTSTATTGSSAPREKGPTFYGTEARTPTRRTYRPGYRRPPVRPRNTVPFMLRTCSIKPASDATSLFQSMPFRCETVVYVVDRSPSMRFHLPGTVSPICNSLSFLGKSRPFQLIYTATDGPQSIGETDASGWTNLIPATSESIAAAKRVVTLQRAETAPDKATGYTSHTVLPAMKQAISLAKGKTTIILISDARGDDINQVLQQVSAMNKSKKASICTVLVGRASQRAVTAMHTLATSNEGKFLYISADQLRANRYPTRSTHSRSTSTHVPSNPFQISSATRGQDREVRMAMNRTHLEMRMATYKAGVTVTRKKNILARYQALIATLKIAEKKLDGVTPEEAVVWVEGTKQMAFMLNRLSRSNVTNRSYRRADQTSTHGDSKQATTNRCIKEFEKQYAHAKKLRIATKSTTKSRYPSRR